MRKRPTFAAMMIFILLMLMQCGAARKSPTSNTNGVKHNKSLSFQQYRSILSFNNEKKFYSVTNTNNETETPIATQNDLWEATQEKIEIEMETKSKSSSSRHSNNAPTFPFVLCHLDESNTCGQERYEIIESLLREEKANSDVDFFLDEIPIYNHIFSKDEKEKDEEKENTDKLNGACFYSSMTSSIARRISSYNMIYATPLSSSLKTRKSSFLNNLNEKDNSEIQIPRAVSIYTSPGVFLSHHKAKEMLTKFSDESKTTCSNDINTAFSVSASSIDKSHFFFEIHDEKQDRVTHECLNLFIDYLTEESDIISVDLVMKTFLLNEIASWIIQGSPEANTLPWYDLGLDGSGEIVQVSDSGLDESHCYLKDNNGVVPLTEDFDLTGKIDNTKRKVIQYVALTGIGDRTDHSHHGSHVVGTILGKRSDDGVNEVTGLVDGIAPASKVAFFDANSDPENDMTFLIPLDISQMFYFGKQAQAFAHSASWGSNSDGGQYSSRVREVDQYFYESEDDDFIMFLAAGNDGSTNGAKIDDPSAAKNVISVGASHSYGKNLYDNMKGFDYVASFSSRGPTADNRIKPDIIAPGHSLLSIKAESNGECDPDYRPQYMGPGNKDHAGLTFKSGTSMSCPVAVGAGALIRQYFQEIHNPSMDISGTLLKAVLINGAEALVGRSTSTYGSESEPSTLYDEFQGYGRLNLLKSLKHTPSSSSMDSPDVHVEDAKILQQGQSHEYEFNVCDTHDFRVTVVWQDPPGQVGCAKCLVNDLDLEVLYDGLTYYPNGRTSRDSRNNVERLILSRDDFTSSDSNSVIVKVKAENLGFGKIQKYSLASNACINDVALVTPTPSPTRSCGLDEFEYTVEIFTNRKPEETSWKLEYQGSEGIIDAVTAGEYGEDVDRLKSFREKGCAMHGCFLFIIKDTGFDGLCCEKGMGSYSIRAGDEILVEGNSFRDRQDIAKFCYFGSFTEDPTASPTIVCSDDEFKYQIDIHTDLSPDETRWELRHAKIDGVDKGTYTKSFTQYEHEGCLDLDLCYSFSAYGLGEYSIKADDFVITDRDLFDIGETKQFCYSSGETNTISRNGIRTPLVGGINWGRPFDNANLWENSFGKIVQIEIYCDYSINTLGIKYDRGGSSEYGEYSGTQHIITLNEEQYIVKVSGRSDSLIRQLKFETNDGFVFGPYGSSYYGDPFEFDFGGNVLVYFFGGQKNSRISQLGFGHASLLQTTDSPTSQPTAFPCGAGQFRYQISIRTEEHPEDISWELHQVIDSIPYMTYRKQLESYSHIGCAAIDDCYELWIIDRRRDGLCCYFGIGSYRLSVGNDILVKGDHFDDSTQVGPMWNPDYFFNRHEFCVSHQPSEAPPSFAVQPTSKPTDLLCRENEFEYRIRIRTHYFPEDIDWKFEYSYGTTIKSVEKGEYFIQHYEYNYKGCILLGECFYFSIYARMGLCCEYGSGGYTIFADHNIMAEGGGELNFETETFCYDGESFSYEPSMQPFSPRPSMQPLVCGDSQFKYEVFVTTDDYPDETYWELSYDDGTIIDSREEGYYTDNYYEYAHKGCINLDSCVTFTIFDSAGDGIWGDGGYVITVNDVVMVEGGGYDGFQDEETHGFCHGPSYSSSPSFHPTIRPTLSPDICESGTNNERWCGWWASIGACEDGAGSRDWMLKNCAKACSNCCIDYGNYGYDHYYEGECEHYASIKRCTSTFIYENGVTWQEWMQGMCRASCGTCDPTPIPAPPVVCKENEFKYEIVAAGDHDYHFMEWRLDYKYPNRIDGYEIPDGYWGQSYYGIIDSNLFHMLFFPPYYEFNKYGCASYSCFDLDVEGGYLKMYDNSTGTLIAQNIELHEKLTFCHYAPEPTSSPTISSSPTVSTSPSSTPLQEALFTVTLIFSTATSDKAEYISAVVYRSIEKLLFHAEKNHEFQDILIEEFKEVSTCDNEICDISFQVCKESCENGNKVEEGTLVFLVNTLNNALASGNLLSTAQQTADHMDIPIFESLIANNPIGIEFDFGREFWPTTTPTTSPTITPSTVPTLPRTNFIQNLFNVITSIFQPFVEPINNITDSMFEIQSGAESHFPPLQPVACTDKMFELQLEIKTDSCPHKTSWELMYINGTMIESKDRDTYTEVNTSHIYNYCLDTSCFIFNLFDSFEFQGSYEIRGRNTVLAHGGSFRWWKDSKHFCYPLCDNNGMFPIQMELVTDPWPHEISWEITSEDGILIDRVEERYYTNINAVYNHRYCLYSGCYDITFHDHIGDGMCCSYGNGFYKFKIDDGEIIMNGGEFGFDETKSFCYTNGEVINEESTFLFQFITGLLGSDSCCTDMTGYKYPTPAPSFYFYPSSQPSTYPTTRPTLYPTTTSSPTNLCKMNQFKYEVFVTTDYFSYETSWELRYDDGTIIDNVEEGSYTQPYKEYLYKFCIDLDSCVTFTIFDSYGDGMWGDGGYVITANDDVIVEGGGDYYDYWYEQTFEFCYGPSISSSPSLHPTIRPTLLPTPNPSMSCEGNQYRYEVIVTTDWDPWGTSWEMKYTNGTIIDSIEQGEYTDNYYEHVHEGCIDLDSCIIFTIFDSYGDGICCGGGYTIFVNDDVMAEGDDGFEEETKTFCYGIASLQPSSSPTILVCDENKFRYEVIVTTDWDPWGTSWEMKYTNGTIIDSIEQGEYTDNYYEHVHEGCIDLDSCIIFTIFDSYGDGICCDGGYTIFVNDVVVVEGGGYDGFQDEETHEFCYGPSISSSPSFYPTLLPTSSNSFEPSTHPSNSFEPSTHPSSFDICESGSNRSYKCGLWASVGFCDDYNYQYWMQKNCGKACANCCVDYGSSCDDYVYDGLCTDTTELDYNYDITWQEWMQTTCREGCDTCDLFD